MFVAGPGDIERVVEGTEVALAVPEVRRLVAAYFDPRWDFPGRDFDRFGINLPCAVTSDDVVAVSLLGTALAPQSIVPLILDQELARENAERLGAVPCDTDLWEYDSLPPAIPELVHTWGERPLTGFAVADALATRKRPRLIPMWGPVVRAWYDGPVGFFNDALRVALRDDHRRERIGRLRPPRGADHVSIVRLLDVAVYMLASPESLPSRARRAVGLEPIPVAAVDRTYGPRL